MEQVIFILLIVFSIGDFMLETTIDWLDVRYSRNSIPSIIADIFTPDKHDKQRAYLRVNTRYNAVAGSISLLFFLVMICWGVAWINNRLLTITSEPMWHTLLFFAIFATLQMLVELPAKAYNTFRIEERFGFNKTTPKLFVRDSFVQWVLSLVLQSILMAVVVFGWIWSPTWFWLIAWAIVSVIVIFINFLYPQIIVPLFNKQTPLLEGELREAINNFASKVGFDIENIYVLDSSKRSTKANAYFTGWGKKRRVVLYDTLIEQLTTEEVVAVLSHEIGHSKHHHTILAMLGALIQFMLMFVLMGMILRYDVFSYAIGCVPTIASKICVCALLYTPISKLTEFIQGLFSRQHEYTADCFAKEHGFAEPLISALKKIEANDLGNPLPHPVTVILTYSHPTLCQRIMALTKIETGYIRQNRRSEICSPR